MNTIDDKKWWLMRVSGKGRTVYLTTAETIEQAKASFGVLAEGREIVPATWSDLHKLIDVAIPCQVDPDVQADRVLTVLTRGHIVVLW